MGADTKGEVETPVALRLLGPVEVVGVDGVLREIGGPRPTTVLIALYAAELHRLTLDELADRCFDDTSRPSDPNPALRTAIRRVRRVLGDEAVHTISGGYQLDLSHLNLDTRDFEESVAAGIESDDPITSARYFVTALEQWRGRPFGHLDLAWVDIERYRLEELHLRALEGWHDAVLQTDEIATILESLERTASENPLRETFWRQLMLGLFLSGRQSDALRAFRRHRDHLIEAGLEPGREIADLEGRIAVGDAELRSGPTSRMLRGYELSDRIGEGTVAVVYRGTQPSIGRSVAVKQIRAELANDPEFIRRFEAEAHLIARLEHPYIVPLYDFWREPDSAYLVMRLFSGGSLQTQLEQGPLTLEDTTKVVDQVGSALAFAHQFGVVHRDVRPANILLDETGSGFGNAFLSDFGIAYDPTDHLYLGRTPSSSSPAYIAPEQIRSEATSPATDVHSLALIAYVALTGSLPFADSPDLVSLRRRQLTEPIPSARASRPDLPPAVDDVLQRATAKAPRDRYQRPDQFAEDLRQACTRSVGHSQSRPSQGRARDPDTATEAVERNPFKGLRSFTEADAADFAGRDRLVKTLIHAVEDHRLVAVVGPSGSGKSSVVQAGLVPALRSGAIGGSDKWVVVSMVPSSNPLDELASALNRIATTNVSGLRQTIDDDEDGVRRALQSVTPARSTTLLIIDQFEETFTLCEDRVQRRQFLDSISAAVSAVPSSLRIVLTLRADFYDHPLRYQSIGRLMQQGTIPVLPLAADELERALVAPLTAVGGTFDTGLVSEIIADVIDRPGALPMMQYALTELYERRDGQRLHRHAYAEMGGLSGALAWSAEEMFRAASKGEQDEIRRIFGRLVAPGDGTQNTRRRMARSELGQSGTVDRVVQMFGDARLLTFDRDPRSREPTVEVAHEALLVAWPRFGQWLDEDREWLRMMRHLSSSAKAWDDADRDSGELYRGARLASFAESSVDRIAELAPLEREFFEASGLALRMEDDRASEQLATRERQHRRLRRSLVLAGILSVLALFATGVAVAQRSSARQQASAAAEARSSAETRRLISDVGKIASTDLRVGLLIAAEAYRRQPDASSLGALKDALTAGAGVLGFVGSDIAFTGISYTTEGELVGTHHGGVVVFDSAGDELRRFDLPGASQVDIDSTGQLAAIVGGTRQIHVIDIESGRELALLPQEARTTRIAFGKSGRVLAVGDVDGFVSIYNDGFELMDRFLAHVPETTLVVPEGEPAALPHEPQTWRLGVTDVSFSPDDSMIATVGGVDVRVWDTDTAAQRHSWVMTRGGDEPRISSTTGVGFWNVEGRPVVVATGPSWVVGWDPESGEMVDRWEMAGGEEATVTLSLDATVDFGNESVSVLARDGRLRTTHKDGSAMVIDSGFGGTLSVAVDPTGQRAVAAGQAGGLVVSLVGRGLISHSIDSLTRSEYYVSTDGSTVVGSSVTDVENAQMWRREGDRFIEVPVPAPPINYAWNGLPQGLGFHYLSRTVQARDPITMEPIGPQFHTASSGAWWSSSGEMIAFTSVDREEGHVEVYAAETGELLTRIESLSGRPGVLPRVARFGPGDSTLLVTDDAGRAVLFDTETWEPISPELSGGGFAVMDAGFSNDGTLMATVAGDGAITFRSTETLQPVGPRVLGNADGTEGFSLGPYFSPNDRWLVSTSDGETRIIDVEARALVGSPFPRNEFGQGNASANGAHAVTLLNGQVVVWNLNVDEWSETACAAAGRNLTAEEWIQFGPVGEPYQVTCAQWPSLFEASDLVESGE